MKWLRIIIFVSVLLLPMNVQAEETETINEIMENFNFSEIDELVEDIFPEEKMNFGETVYALLSGELDITLELVMDLILDQFVYEINASRSGMIQILVLMIVAAIFANFSDVFKSTQVAEIGFAMLYMLLVVICLGNFRILAEVTGENVERLTNFMEVLSPLYFFAVSLATGSVTSVAFYQLILILIYFVELIILNFLLPVAKIYMVVRMLGEMSKEIQLTKFAELLETIVSWSLKTLFAGVVGLNVIQRLLSPAVDAVKRSVLTRGGEALPIIGDAIGGVTEVVLGTTVLIKNGIGVAGMLVCLAICLTPILQMAMTALVYQLLTALIQPISDKRMVNCVSSMAGGVKMLLRMVFTTSVLFLLTIAVVASTTGG